jgi:hypothetical protein
MNIIQAIKKAYEYNCGFYGEGKSSGLFQIVIYIGIVLILLFSISKAFKLKINVPVGGVMSG